MNFQRKLTHLLLCGGSGTRLWPLSQKDYPKQFLKLFEEKSTFQRNIEGNRCFCHKQIICSHIDQKGLVIEQLQELSISPTSYVWEPLSRNTAAAITLACLTLSPEEIVLVTPADQLIDYSQHYREALFLAHQYASQGNLVAFGIKPLMPHPGYGYLQTQDDRVVAFHEKPSRSKAQEYLSQPNFFWNSGLYCFKVQVFLEEMSCYAPTLFKSCQQLIESAREKQHQFDFPVEEFIKLESISIDFALMEKTAHLKFVPAHFGWSDIGSFESLYQQLPSDEHGNTVSSKNVYIESKNTFAFSSKKVVASLGTEDLMIIDMPNTLFVTKKQLCSKFKELLPHLEQLKKEYKPSLLNWGSIDLLEQNEHYQVKKITIFPNQSFQPVLASNTSAHYCAVIGNIYLSNIDTTQIFQSQSFTLKNTSFRIENRSEENVTLIETLTFLPCETLCPSALI